MTYEKVAEMIEEMGIPFSYYQFDNDTAVDPPFICFYYPENIDVLADGENYKKIETLTIELYTDNKDFDMEAAVEKVLKAHGLVFARSESYIDSEKMHMVTYQTSVLIEEVQNNDC